MKLAFITDSNEAFVSFQKDLVLEEWGTKETQIVTDLGNVGGMTLFGPTPVSILPLESSDHVKKLVKKLEKEIEDNTLSAKLESGLIITSSLNKNSTRSLQKLLEPIGSIYSTKSGSVGEAVVSHMNLNRETEDFLLGYLGQDYAAAIPLARSIRELSKKEQAAITVENLYYRLPKKPGSIPPWEIEAPLLKGNIPETVEKYRRIVGNTGALLPLSILNNKFRLVFRVASILEDNPRVSNAELSSILKVPNNYPLKLAVGNAKRLGLSKIEEIVLILADVERQLKGGGGGPADTIVELGLVKIARIVRR